MYVYNLHFWHTKSNLVADDLGVIAEVLVCESFKTKFEADDTQTLVSQTTWNMEISNNVTGD